MRTIKTYKASKLYVDLYGREAYEAWKTRKAEIDKMRLSGKHSKGMIISLYEDSFRQMKAAGEHRLAA